MIKKLCYILYSYVAMYLPDSDSKTFGKMSSRVRTFLFKKITGNTSVGVNIQKGAKFSTNVKIGNNSSIGINALVSSDTTIGDYVIMGPDVAIYTSNHETSRIDIPIKKQGNSNVMGVTIGNDVWIGTRTVILPGVKIGDGSIIGACSVVTKDVAPYTVVGGNPAKKIKDRITN